MKKILFLSLFSIICVHLVGQTKTDNQKLSSPEVVFDVVNDTINWEKVMSFKDDIIKAAKDQRAFVYSEIQNGDSLSWFIYPDMIRCYTYNSNLPNLVFYKHYSLYSLNNKTFIKCGYYLDEHNDDMFSGYGTKVGIWKDFTKNKSDNTVSMTEENFDESLTIPWYEAFEIAMTKLKCTQEDLELRQSYDSVSESTDWIITDPQKNKYKIDGETGEFSKLPEPEFSFDIVETNNIIL